MVYLITGKAGSGKTTYATRLMAELTVAGHKTWMLDGDWLRASTANDDFSDTGREKNLKRAAGRAAQREKNGYIVVLAFVAPKKEWRQMMRRMWQASHLVYMPGGILWQGTTYETPDKEELTWRTG